MTQPSNTQGKWEYDRPILVHLTINSCNMKSNQALCAKAIRQELKKEFPDIKFIVNSESFAGGDAVNILHTYPSDITIKQVEEIVRKYQYGHFDGMNDIYEYSNNRKDIPQVKYVQVRIIRYITEKLGSEVKL